MVRGGNVVVELLLTNSLLRFQIMSADDLTSVQCLRDRNVSFVEWVDDELPLRVTALINNLKNENEALRRERNLLLMKVVEIERALAGNVTKIEDFKEFDDVKGENDVSKEKMDGGLVL
ncbi:PREDICTED: uncharacterized protein LOC109236173 [Nicotiana attenuata]|uniref:Uncharacterized protein n=1 Tax=Nicotiana attenuata TaxID=49451 RepID=A0A1J6IDQ1_NICAT|nr:PREDICTED: uncharacterized protein LOC109236173 [Nicotiana attenuata]OIS95902.1 hypothetical protein A4A49_10654 [Nicotiana attenuata]